MEAERKPVFTKVHIFGAIADAAYERMSEDMGRNVRPMLDGSAGTIKTFDPGTEVLQGCDDFSCFQMY